MRSFVTATLPGHTKKIEHCLFLSCEHNRMVDAEAGMTATSSVNEVGSTDNTSNIESNEPQTAWYLHGKYDRYWKHHQDITNWYNNHLYAVWYANTMTANHMHSLNTLNQAIQPHCSFVPPNTNSCCACTCNSDQSSNRKFKRNKFRKGKNRNSGKRKANFSPTSQDDHLSGEEHVEITDEMLEFFTKTRKHQKEWKELQKELMAKEAAHKRVDMCQVSRESSAATSSAPSEQIGHRRSSEMKQLYGKGAALIHGMETALQLSFDRHYDLKQPKLWPNIPLNMTFT